MIGISERSIDSFKKALSGKSYKNIGDEYGVSGERIRQNVMVSMRYIRSRLDYPDELKGLSRDINDARSNKELWLTSLDKALRVVTPKEQDMMDIKKTITDYVLKQNETIDKYRFLLLLERHIRKERRKLCFYSD